MFTFLGNFRCIIFNSYSSVIVFLDTRRKPKLFQTGWRVLNTDLQEHPSQGGCAGRAQSPGMHIWVGMGTGGHGCVGDTGLGTNGGEGVPKATPSWPAHSCGTWLAQGWDQLCSISHNPTHSNLCFLHSL